MSIGADHSNEERGNNRMRGGLVSDPKAFTYCFALRCVGEDGPRKVELAKKETEMGNRKSGVVCLLLWDTGSLHYLDEEIQECRTRSWRKA